MILLDACSETWLSPHSYLDCFSIPGYVFITDNRTYSSGGGVGLYVNSDRKFHLRDDLTIDTIENVWIETQDLIIDVIYKPPSLSNRLTRIYYSLVYAYLIYGCLLWGNNYDNPLSQLIRLQNKAVRIMNDVPLRDHITPHYVHLGL